jgi:thiol:disulfide interchange protein DsbD
MFVSHGRHAWDKLGFMRRVISSSFCRIAAACGLLLALPFAPAGAQDVSDLVKVELLAAPAAITPGEPFQVGIRLTMKEHWHTYWRNPGDSGEPTTVAWTLPDGFSVSALEWPAPSLIKLGPVTSFGYEGEAVLLARITPPRDLKPGSGVTLNAEVAFLVCEKECIPGEANVSLPLPVSDNAASGGAASGAAKKCSTTRAANCRSRRHGPRLSIPARSRSRLRSPVQTCAATQFARRHSFLTTTR